MSIPVRTRVLPVLLASVALVAAGCGSGSSKSASTPTSGGPSGGPSAAPASSAKASHAALRIPFYDDMGVPDPDVFYGAEGLMVTNGVYDSLLQYGPDSFKVEGEVVALPKLPPDGRTYTFPLHAGLPFHDGTPLNSAAVAASFARRTAVKQGPS